MRITHTCSSLALSIVLLLFCPATYADINPWIAANVYNPAKWDTSGPSTATPWLHPPTWSPGQDWGVFSGRWQDITASSGSWGGLRDKLVKEGLSFTSAYFGQFASNPVGGRDVGGSSWRGDLGLAIYLDLERVASWKGGYFTSSFSYKNGTESISPAFVGNQFSAQVTSDFNGAATARLVHLAVGQQLFDNNVEIVTGRIIAGEDFGSIRLACTSLNQALCGNPIAATQNISFPTYPFATWGGRIKIKPRQSWYAQIGSYLVYDTFRDPSFHGVKFSVQPGAGALVLGEVGYIVGKYRGVGSLPGKYKFGGYYDSERITNQESQTDGYGTWGLYTMAQQMLYAEDNNYNQGLSVFFSLSYAPPSRNLIKFMAAGGLSYQGLIPGRPQDALALVTAYGRYSNARARGQRARGETAQDFELLLEANYRIQVAPWIFLQPSVQGIIHPAGDGSVPDALVIGFAFGVIL